MPLHGCPGTTTQVTSDSKSNWTKRLMPNVSPSRSTKCKKSLYGSSLQISPKGLTMLPTWLPVSVHTWVCRNTFPFFPAPWTFLHLYAGYPHFTLLNDLHFDASPHARPGYAESVRVSDHVTAQKGIYRTKQIPSCQVNLLKLGSAGKLFSRSNVSGSWFRGDTSTMLNLSSFMVQTFYDIDLRILGSLLPVPPRSDCCETMIQFDTCAFFLYVRIRSWLQ
ncbi:hypothetical protein BDV97DRAFT_80991 [Delphinella strobiligena]|nr:hypothetical protein BDV97DRAFT_80991 [Delphinella strobiligena]